MKNFVLLISTICLFLSGCSQDPGAGATAPEVIEIEEIEYSPYVGDYDPEPLPANENRPLFGDTHLHTSYSVDAGMVGNVLDPPDAYRYARGEVITASNGVRTRLKRPLDFLVVADHAEALGVAPMIRRSDPSILEDPLGKQLHALVMEDTTESLGEAFNLFTRTKNEGTNSLASNMEFPIVPWEEIIDAAEANNEPGKFTAFIGFEWTSGPGGNNLHRVVVFRDGKDVANTRIPLSSDLNPDPEYLWDWMEQLENDTGGRLLAIPHNGNVSNGLMFSDNRLDPSYLFTQGKSIDAEYAERRMRFEPLYEVTQMKGDGEAHPLLSTTDEFADFETWDQGFNNMTLHTEDMIPYEYAREALKRGLVHEKNIGINPFKFGMIGSTDAHTSLSTTGEDNFFGKVSVLEPSNKHERFYEVVGGRILEEATKTYAWQTSASGLAAVWAKKNTRESIFEAMERKEVYATTGTRMRVRVFAGFDFQADDLSRDDFVDYAYSNGVPMGADLRNTNGATPKFLIRAAKDPDGANLDRVQIIKGWLDTNGETQERIYDVAVSDGRSIEADGRSTAPVGNTVNVADASYTNTIGDPMLTSFWEDPEFDPSLNAFYYVRVIEIPTPRWTTYDVKFFGVELPEGAPLSIQERAYTSPIWYSPK